MSRKMREGLVLGSMESLLTQQQKLAVMLGRILDGLPRRPAVVFPGGAHEQPSCTMTRVY
jgi:hypothetical protein